ncbi:MAG TPA: DUF1616 domain-containing protein [Candidatus Binatia bacterium]|nr:DUF1616 domain-containing protein [Candidatus Binatia bacterium]
MKLKDYKLIFVAVGLVGILLIASPALSSAVHTTAGEPFSELYILNLNHMAENYPSNVAIGHTYSIYVVVGNHLGSSAYYSINVKLKNQTDFLPNTRTATPSPLQPLYNYRFSIPDGQNWEAPFTFTVSNASISGKQSTINQLTVNDIKFDVNKSAAWDSNSSRFVYELVFELWLYDGSTSSIQFNSRFVDLQLNLTKTP